MTNSQPIATPFWGRVQFGKTKVNEKHTAHRSEFRKTGNLRDLLPFTIDGKAVWLISVENEDRCVTAGAVVECPLQLVAQKLVERTHDYASADQVEAHLARTEDSRRLIAEVNDRLAGKRSVVVQSAPAPEPLIPRGKN